MATLETLIESTGSLSVFREIQFEIDENLRTIAVPEESVIIGVNGDKNVNYITFKMARYYNGLDMSSFAIRINYVLPDGTPNYTNVVDKLVGDDYFAFAWLVNLHMSEYKGEIQFSVRLLDIEVDGSIKRQFYTTIAKCKVLEGVYAESYVSDDSAQDLITTIANDVTSLIETKKTTALTAIDSKSTSTFNEIECRRKAVLAELPETYTTISSDVTQLKQNLGVLSNLQTTAKNNIVAAINEVKSSIGSSGSSSTSDVTKSYVDEQDQEIKDDLDLLQETMESYENDIEQAKTDIISLQNRPTGLSSTAKTLLITILTEALFGSDQYSNITALQNALNDSD